MTTAVDLTVNGERHEVRVEPRKLLSDVLREDLRLTGTHVGCEHGVCGACTVLRRWPASALAASRSRSRSRVTR